MSRLRNSLDIAKSSFRVLQSDKELLVLPVISGLATLVTIGLFAVPIFFTSGGFDTAEPGPAQYVVMFVMYLVLAYITIFFNTALVSATHERLNGGDPTIGSALRGATSRAGKILPWALVSATVSIILRSLEERAGAIGSFVLGLIGMAWAVVTYLVLPIIVIEGLGVGDSVKRSTDMFKRTWGENLSAQVGFGLIAFFLALPGIGLVLLGFTGGLWIPAIGGIVWLAALAIVMSTLSVIFQTALYHFAADGVVPGGYFDNSTFTEAFRTKRQQRRYL